MKRLTVLGLVVILAVIAAIAPARAQGTTELKLVPFTDETFGFTSLKPEGWKAGGPGLLVRGSKMGDATLIAQQAAPLKASAVLNSLLPQLGLTEAPKSTGAFQGDALDWTLYNVKVAVTVDFALAEAEGKTYIVLVQSAPDEAEQLYKTLFTPVLKALTPLVETVEAVPYQAEEVTFKNGDITLAGTLTLSEGDGPFPAVILVSGSGPQNRDEELGGGIAIKPFKLIADYLTRQGIAVLRYDDRGVAKSTGDFDKATTDDFASDARAALDYLLTRKDIAPRQIGLLGHSEGGLVAAKLGASEPRLAYVISLSGPAVSGMEVLLAQNEAILRANGATEEQIKANVEGLSKTIEEVLKGDAAAARKAIEDLVKVQVAALSKEQLAQLGDLDKYIPQAIDQALKQFDSPWFKAFLAYNPGDDWAKTTMPVLALFGGKDLQVLTDQNRGPFEAAMKKAGNTKYKVVEFAEANHLYQASTTGSPTEYGTLKQEFVPDLLPTIAEWIKAQVKAS